MQADALSACAVVKSFGAVRALDGLSLAIARGEIFGLLGPNGAGKTTALRIICGLLAPDSGSGHCLAVPLGQRAAGLGYMPQRGGLYDDLTVAENLRFFARAHGLGKSAVTGALDRHGLAAQVTRRVGTLSGGWRQRVALAVALLHAPQLILLDEPTAGLDPEARERLWQQLRELSADGVSLLVTTHYADEAERCDRIGYLAAGRLLAEGVPDRLAGAIGLKVWRLDQVDRRDADGFAPRAASPPPVAGLRYLRDSAGWRLITRHQPELPAPLPDWCAGAGWVARRAEPRLGDALCWLAADAGDRP